MTAPGGPLGPPAPTPLRPAGLVSRLLAVAVDAFVLATCFAALHFGIVALGAVLIVEVRLAARLGNVIEGLAVVGLVPVYHVVGWRLFGMTAGKWLLGIQVVGPDGGRPRLARSALRFAAYTISIPPLLAGVLAVAFNRERLAWHDRIARTRVVRGPSVKTSRSVRVELVGSRR